MDHLIEHIAETKQFENLLARILWTQLKTSGVPETGGKRKFLHEAVGAPGVLDSWFGSSLDVLVERGLLANVDGTLSPTDKLTDADDPWQAFEDQRDSWNRDGPVSPVLKLVETAVRAVPDVLSGKRRATEVLFPGGSLDLAAPAYQANPLSDHFNAIVADTVVKAIRSLIAHNPDAQIRILEIGAGTGATSAAVLARLEEFPGRIATYCYTDISRAFLVHGQTQFAAKHPFLDTRIFNVEKPLSSQNLEPGQFDIALATNVLHATKDIRRTLRHVKAMLRANGLLIVNELVARSFPTHLTFGLLDGWWLHEDTHLRLAGSPLLTYDGWKRVLEAEGFNSVMSPGEAHPDFEQQVFVAQSDGLIRLSNEKQKANGAKPPIQATVRQTQAPAKILPSKPKQARVVAKVNVQQRLSSHLKEAFARALGVPISEIDVTAPVETYGMDSILSVQLANELGKTFDAISVPMLFEYNTISALAEYLSETQEAKARDVTKSPDAVEAKPILDVQEPPARLPVAAKRLSSPRLRPSADTSGHIAIVGVAGRYPGGEDLNAFWNVLREGRSAIREVPADRWDWRDGFDRERGKAGRTYARFGGFLDAIDTFDPLFFRLSPREAERMDPQERLFLETAYACIEDAGYAPLGMEGDRSVGVFVGVTNGYYPTGAYYWSISNRVSYALDLTGPSLSVDTACSSSLTAIHLAVESLRNGSCSSAIAGGVNLVFDPKHYVMLSEATMLSAGDKLRAFGAGADGFVDGEGVGAVLLKPLSRAQTDGDRIYGVIRGTAVNHGGKANGYMVPNPRAQGRAIENALRSAGVDARNVSYVEAHGTGTAIGDPIEIAGLSRAFSAFTEDRGFCAIGSAKSNIGHCESAAGIAGLTKVLLQMKHGELVPSLHAETLNPHINFEASPFVVQRELTAWNRPLVNDGSRELPRVAGISSFGGGGSNAHLVIEEYVLPTKQRTSEGAGPQVLVLSGRTEERLRMRAQDVLAALSSEPLKSTNLADIAYTLQVGRDALDERLALIVNSVAELESKLKSWLSGNTAIEGLWSGRRRERDGVVGLFGEADISEIVERWTADGQLERLAEAWCRGVSIRWQALHREGERHRVELPTYPFEKKRYWFEGAATYADARPSSPLALKREPLPEPRPVEVQVSLPARDPTGHLGATLITLAADLMKIDADDLSLDTDLSDYGFDSITFAQLANRLNQAHQLDVTASDFLEARTLGALVSVLITQQRGGDLLSAEPASPLDARLNDSPAIVFKAEVEETVLRQQSLPPRASRPADQVLLTLRDTAADLMKMQPDEIALDGELSDYGFDSITLAQLANRLNQTLGCDLTASDFLEAGSLQRLVPRLQIPCDPRVDLEETALLSPAAERSVPLSYQQQWLLREIQNDPNANYHVPLVLRLSGTINEAALRSAVGQLIARHDSLRTLIRGNGEICARVVDTSAFDVPFVMQRLNGSSLAEKLTMAREVQRALIASPFNLDVDLPLRVTLLRLSADDHLLVVVVHHIVSDGASIDIIGRELAELYAANVEGREPRLSVLTASYASYVESEGPTASAKALSDLDYWRETLRDAPVESSLPFEQPRPELRSHTTECFDLALPPGIAADLRALAKRTGTTPFMVLAAGLEALVARLSGRTDVVIGTAVTARNRAEYEPLVGYFANTLALRANLSGDLSFEDLLKQIKDSALNAYGHAALRFERLVDDLEPVRHLARHPLFQLMITFRKMAIETSMTFGPVATARYEPPELLQMPFDLMVQFLEGRDDVAGQAVFSTDVFDRETVERTMACYVALLRAVIVNPSLSLWSLPLLPAEDVSSLRSVSEGGQLALPGVTGIHRIVARQARVSPDATAVVFGERALTYGQLDQAANRMAHHLQALGIERRSVVAVCLDRSEIVPVVLLGILKAGAAYLIVNTDGPQQILDDAKASLFIAGPEVLAAWSLETVQSFALTDAFADVLAGYPETAPAVISQADDIAYIASVHEDAGSSTGVMMSHGALFGFLAGLSKRLNVTGGNVCGAIAPLAWDLASTELWLPLTTGATLTIADDEALLTGETLCTFLHAQNVTHVQAKPCIWRAVFDADDVALPRSLTAVTVGASLDEAVADSLREHVQTAWSVYWPAEATLGATIRRIDETWRLGSLGEPMENTKVYAVDRNLQLVPLGASGEICIAGAGLALGHVGHPGLSGERFPSDPFGSPGAHMYRTGDLGRICRDGSITLHGRLGGDPSVTKAMTAVSDDGAPKSVLLRAGSYSPLFLFHALAGGPQIYTSLLRTLDAGQKCIGLSGVRPTPDVLQDLAAEYASEILRIVPDGDVRLAGWSFGGLLAFETARCLLSRGVDVRMLSLIDVNLYRTPTDDARELGASEIWDAFCYVLTAEQSRSGSAVFGSHCKPEDFEALSLELNKVLRPTHLQELHAVFARNMRAWNAYRPSPLDVNVDLYRVSGSSPMSRGLIDWEKLAKVGNSTMLSGDHFSVLHAPHVHELGRHLQKKLIDIGPQT